jgi:aspartate racemase
MANRKENDKVIGIMGGMGPEATIDLFEKIVRETHAKTDEDHLRIIIDNNPKMPSRQDAILKGTESPGPAMAETAKNIERAGADCIIIGANTAHYFYKYVKDAVHIPVLHIIEETVKETTARMPNVTTVGVLATSGAMKTGIFQKQFESVGIRTLGIPEDFQQKIQKSVFSFKYDGQTSKNVAMMVEVGKFLIKNGAEALILGCTEIPLILRDKSFTVPMIDPNEVIARVAVKFAKCLRR